MKESNERKLKNFATGLAVGGIIAGGGVYAATVSASNVSYNNSTTGMNTNSAQGAIDTLQYKVDKLEHKNKRLRHVRYFYQCHSYEIPGSLWKSCNGSGHETIHAISVDENGGDYVSFKYNLAQISGSSIDTSTLGNKFLAARKGCCSTTCTGDPEVTACNAICNNGYNQNYLTT